MALLRIDGADGLIARIEHEAIVAMFGEGAGDGTVDDVAPE